MLLTEQHLKLIKLGNCKGEEQERLARESAEAERKHKEEEEAKERAALEAAEKEAGRARMQREKAKRKPCHLALNLKKDMILHKSWFASQMENAKRGGSTVLLLSSLCMTMLILWAAKRLRLTALFQIFPGWFMVQKSSYAP